MTAKTTDTGTGSGAMLTQLSVLDYRPVRIGSGAMLTQLSVLGYWPVRTGSGVIDNRVLVIGRLRPVLV